MTSYPPLTQDDDLASFPGAPFTSPVIRAAEKAIRNEVNWHIAPPVLETLVVEASDPFRLVLPTLRIVAVDSITAEDGTVLVDYKTHAWGEIQRQPATLSEDGETWTWTDDVHHRRFHVGREYQVELTHGYDEASDLLPVVAALCLRSITDSTLTQRSETVGQRTSSESYNTGRIGSPLKDEGSPVGNYRLISFGR